MWFSTPPFPECIGQAGAHKTEKHQRRINERNFSLNAKLSRAGFALSELRPYHTKGRSFVCKPLFLTEASGAVFVCWVLIIEMHKQPHRCAHELESVCVPKDCGIFVEGADIHLFRILRIKVCTERKKKFYYYV